MHFQAVGPPDAPTILFLHALGTSGWMWEEIVGRLEGYRCLVPDLPGHGGSAGVPWESLDRTVDGLAELLDRHATGGRAHVVGLSLGGYAALQLLARRPDRIDRAVLSGLNVLPFPNPVLMRVMGLLMLPLLKRDVFLRLQARALRIPQERFEGYRGSARAMSHRAFLRIGGELMTFRPDPALALATNPTLVLAGEREQPLVRRSIPEILRALPSAEGYLAPGVGHGWSGEAPELFARAVKGWCEGGGVPGELRRVG